MSQENVDWVRRSYEHFARTGELARASPEADEELPRSTVVAIGPGEIKVRERAAN